MLHQRRELLGRSLNMWSEPKISVFVGPCIDANHISCNVRNGRRKKLTDWCPTEPVVHLVIWDVPQVRLLHQTQVMLLQRVKSKDEGGYLRKEFIPENKLRQGCHDDNDSRLMKRVHTPLGTCLTILVGKVVLSKVRR